MRLPNQIMNKQRHTPLAGLLVLILLAMPVAAFDLNSNTPISVSANTARLDDNTGIATYTGDVVVTQDQTRLTADRVILYRDAEGLTRIEAFGTPAHYQQPAKDGQGETDARALNITYAAKENQLTFEQEAVIEQAGNLFRGDRIDYNTAERIVTATGAQRDDNSQGRVETVIQPRNQPESSSPSDSSENGTKP